MFEPLMSGVLAIVLFSPLKTVTGFLSDFRSPAWIENPSDPCLMEGWVSLPIVYGNAEAEFPIGVYRLSIVYRLTVYCSVVLVFVLRCCVGVVFFLGG